MSASPSAQLENKIGVQPLEELLEQRRYLVGKVAELRARFGNFGTWDHQRKITLSQCKMLIRMQAMEAKRRITGDEVDAEAHTHPDYVQMVIEATHQRAEWTRLEAEIEAIEFTIHRGQALVRYVTGEMRL